MKRTANLDLLFVHIRPAPPIVTFLLKVLLIPEQIEDGLVLKLHFEHNRGWFFVPGALLLPVDALDTYLRGVQHFGDQGVIYLLTILFLFILMVIASITSNRRYHAFFAIVFFVYILVFIHKPARAKLTFSHK